MKISLEQWQTLVAVVDAGGYAAAAEHLHKSQSSISYGIQRIEHQLGVPVFRLVGRKAELTDQGRSLYRHARRLLASAHQLEAMGQYYARGDGGEIRIALDMLCPIKPLWCSLNAFAQDYPMTKVTWLEASLSGSEELLLQRQADLVICPQVPVGFLGEPLLTVEMLAVAHPQHPLHQLGSRLTLEDLRQYRQLVIKDSGRQNRDAGWLDAEQRWTFSHIQTSIAAACEGLGFAWYPLARIKNELAQGRLQPLPLAQGARRFVHLSLVVSAGEFAPHNVRRLAHLMRVHCQSQPLSDDAN
ncbi:DNA-binding transcriptional regulator, LysR family [Allopseudospirillum japonicum]|uniref:DNA-binding transcriptional regulator, LysR family n=1 Tax=Allopseudospirillum japonicum TaxID=64971 RepID=A0A1H6SXS6_9GAMM|nr:LysR family transcriptional regulator [Allopseudospirillum japonicum]SEI72708.1 DNA-binding transcriptional regulator, LysR family [Allopseudospirillum japonicum]